MARERYQKGRAPNGSQLSAGDEEVAVSPKAKKCRPGDDCGFTAGEEAFIGGRCTCPRNAARTCSRFSPLAKEAEIPEALLYSAIRKGALARELTPVYMGSAYKNKGVQKTIKNQGTDF